MALQPSDGGIASAAAAATPDTTRLAGKGRRSTTPEPDEIVQLYLAEKLQLGTSLNDAENLQRAEKELRQADADKRSYTPEDWARVDQTMKTHVNMRNELQLRVESLASQLGESHQAVIRAKEDLAARQRYMDGYAQLLNAKFIIRWKEDGTGGALIPRDLSPLREHVARLAAQDEAMSKKVDEMRVRRQSSRRRRRPRAHRPTTGAAQAPIPVAGSAGPVGRGEVGDRRGGQALAARRLRPR